MDFQTRTASTEAAPSSRHIPELDGLRGLAILLVLLCHGVPGPFPAVSALDRAVVAIFSAGWIGVDIFFVLSGFLITGILIDAKDSPHYFRNFYLRRTLRIFPLYYASLAAMTAAAFLPPLRERAGTEGWRTAHGWYWAYLVNFMIAVRGWNSAPCGTGHLWSLSVEEQFYLAWPGVVRWLRERWILPAALSTLLAAPLMRLLLIAAGARPEAVYVLTPARIDCLGLGAVLAFMHRTPGGLANAKRRLYPAAATGAALLVGIVFTRRHEAVPLSNAAPSIQILGFTALALLAGALLVAAVTDERVGCLFRGPVLRGLGKYSYCLYVVYGPILYGLDALMRGRWFAPIGDSYVISMMCRAVLLFALSFAIAWISWRVLESPFLRLKRRAPYGPG